MKLTLLSIDSREGLISLACEGSVTSADFSPDGKNPMESIIGPLWSRNKILLDFSRTSYIDSSAIGWLINTHKEFKKNGGAIVVHTIPPKVEQVLNLLKIGKVVPLAKDAETGKTLLNGGAQG